MKPIKKSGWYHVIGEKINHYFNRETKISLCCKINPVETYYTKSICPDCKADCVIISSKPTLKDIIHIHPGCPASD